MAKGKVKELGGRLTIKHETEKAILTTWSIPKTNGWTTKRYNVDVWIPKSILYKDNVVDGVPFWFLFKNGIADATPVTHL